MGIVEARGVKENQAVAFELRIIRNGIDDYRHRVFGTRGCAVPDLCDDFTDSNVNELNRNSATLERLGCCCSPTRLTVLFPAPVRPIMLAQE